MPDLPGMVKRMRRVRAYRRLFLDETGRLTPDAEIVLGDLYEFTRFFNPQKVDLVDLEFIEGGRRVVRRILQQTRTTNLELKRHLIGDDDAE